MVKRSNEYNQLLRLYKNSMIWKTGDYQAICKIHIADTNEYIEHLFHFTLSDIEIDTLKRILDLQVKL